MSKNGTNGKEKVKADLGKQDVADLVHASVLALFFVQKLGKASAADVEQHMGEIGATINEHLLDQALEGLRGRGLLSYARGSKKDGEKVRMYKTTKVKWAAPPEVAHIKDFLPALVETEEARHVINVLNGSEEAGDGMKKSKRQLGYAEYWEITTRVRLLNPILGSQPSSPWMRKIIAASAGKIKAPKECDLRFWRDEETGDVIIPSDVTAGWARNGARFGLSKSDVVGKYLIVDDIRITPKEIYQVELPIISEGKGAGLNTYELIPKGTEFDIRWRIPARGLADPMSFLKWFASYAPRPERGLSPARGKRFGKMELIDYTIHGESKFAETALSAIENSLESDDAKKIFAELFAHAAAHKTDLSKVDKGGVKQKDIN